MRPLIERVTRLKDTVGARPAARPAFPDGLTQREVEVIRLVAAGKTDREIAEELIISVNTVGNHVRSILNKTNAANRTEAAAYAALRGLTGRRRRFPQCRLTALLQPLIFCGLSGCSSQAINSVNHLALISPVSHHAYAVTFTMEP